MNNEISKAMYYWWRKLRDTKAPNLFDSFGEFCNWSVANGYEYGTVLRRIDPSLAYSPDNCIWSELQYRKKFTQSELKEYIARWDNFVNPIRERFRNELEAVQNSAEEQPRRIPKVRETFKYEHPDLVREGIVWIGS